MLRVAHICTAASMYKLLVDKLTILKGYGYDIDLISSDEGYNEELMKHYDFDIKFIHINREINLIDDIKSIYNLVKLLNKEKYDIVHTHNAKAGIVGRIAGKIAKIPVVIHTSHGLPFYKGQKKVKFHLYKFIEKIGSFFCDAIGSQNLEDLDLIRNYITKKRTYYEGNGVDVERLYKLEKNIDKNTIQSLKSNLGISDSTKVILVGARFEPIKGHEFLLQGLYVLKQKYKPDFVCLLAGRGNLQEKIQSKINELGLNNEVKIIGYKTDLYPYIKLADLIVLTSKKEGIPRILMESMAFSKPVVATDVLGTRELVKNTTGFLVPFNDQKQLAEKIMLLLNDKGLRKKFGYNAYKLIEKEFTESIVAGRIDSIYKEILSRKGVDL